MTHELPSHLEQLEVQFIPELKAAVNEQRPFSLDVELVRVLREALETSGVNFDISPEERKALVSGNMLRSQVLFRGRDAPIYVEIYSYEEKKWERFEDAEFKDRSLGMNAMLGEKRFEDIVEHCYLMMLMVGYDGRIGKNKDEGTRGRGFTQAAGDFLQIALQDPDAKDLSEDTMKAITRLNRRLLRAHLKKTPEEEHGEIISKFKAAEIEKPKKVLASFEPRALPGLVYYLVGYRE